MLILDLCGGTGAWSYFYRQRGYDVRVITLPEHDVMTYEPPADVHGILAAPPCNDWTLHNGFRQPGRSVALVTRVMDLITQCKPAWFAVENPKGSMIAELLGRPTMSFEAWEYGDPWFKPTSIWGDFTIPERVMDHPEEVGWTIGRVSVLSDERHNGPIGFAQRHPEFYRHADITKVRGDNGKDESSNRRSMIRAVTPAGWAKAFTDANP